MRRVTESSVRPYLLVSLLAILLAGCLRAPAPPPSPPEGDEYLAGPSGEPIEIEYTFPGDDQPTRLTAELYDGTVLIEGDIALGTVEEVTAAGMLGSASHAVPAVRYWPATSAAPPYVYEAPYVISDDFSEAYVRDVIQPAIDHWNVSTNLELVERDGQPDYVSFVVGDRCWANAGHKGGKQEIQLGEDLCTRIGTVVHEIGHAVGLKHEQQRTDRDEYVEIVEENIEPGKEGNFTIYWEGQPLGAYDYTSVMHYRSTAFAIEDENGVKLTTIDTLGAPIAPASRLTDAVIAAVRRIYPEDDLPFAAITEPASGDAFDEGVEVSFAADVVLEPRVDETGLSLAWSYDRNGVPFHFGTSASGETVSHRFCDGVHNVTVEASLPGVGVVATDTVQVPVNDLGMTGPPAMCAISVQIDEPLDGAVYAEGVNIALVATIADDHPETDDPLYPVTWRLTDPADGQIVGTGRQSTTKLGAGQHTIYVTYGSAVDSVTLTVEEAGTPPVAAIAAPDDESVHDWAQLDGVNSYLDIDFAGSAFDAQEGPLSGADLSWEVRRAGEGAYAERGTGTSPTLRFPMETGTVRYDVRLTATDSDGMTDSEVIQVVVVWPPS